MVYATTPRWCMNPETPSRRMSAGSSADRRARQPLHDLELVVTGSGTSSRRSRCSGAPRRARLPGREPLHDLHRRRHVLAGGRLIVLGGVEAPAGTQQLEAAGPSARATWWRRASARARRAGPRSAGPLAPRRSPRAWGRRSSRTSEFPRGRAGRRSSGCSTAPG